MSALKKTKNFFEALERKMASEYTAKFEAFSLKIKQTIPGANIKTPENFVSFWFEKGFLYSEFCIFTLYSKIQSELLIESYFSTFFNFQKNRDYIVSYVEPQNTPTLSRVLQSIFFLV